MRFGVVLPTYWPEAHLDAIAEIASRAEELGFASVWAADHVMVGKSDTTQFHYVHEAVTVLAWLSAITKRVRLGLSVLVLPQRDPVLVAKQIATLDVLSGGRLVAGVGAGWSKAEFGFLGADFAHRGGIMDDAIGVLRHLWAGVPDPYRGPHFGFAEHTFAPLPVQRGGPPIWVGGNSDAAMRRAARLGDAWHGGGAMADPVAFARAAELIARTADDRQVELTLHARVGSMSGWRIDPAGTPGYQGTRQLVIGGPAESITAHFKQLARLGCSHVAINFWDRDLTETREAIERFARRVMPAFE
jgi:probable F420-dependent oxidoreductase